MGSRKQVDKAKEQRAWTAATLRTIVAGYIAYLGYKIAFAKDTTMSKSTAVAFGVMFGLAALFIIGYVIYRLRIDLAAARLPDEPEQKEPESEGDSDDGV